MSQSVPMRIAKVIARSGLCSRRGAEDLIKARRVCLNGVVISEPGIVVSEKDNVMVDNNPLRRTGPTKVWAVHKLKGELVTRNDPQGRPTVEDRFKKMGVPDNLMAIGRLDYNTEGLLLHTNDGDLSRYLELPSNGIRRRYLCLVKGTVQQPWLRSLKRKGGSTFGGQRYRPIDAKILRKDGPTRTWIDITLTEGKNREIRRIMKAMKLDVKQLIRIEYGPYKLGELPPGAAMQVPLKFEAPSGPNGVKSYSKGWNSAWQGFGIQKSLKNRKNKKNELNAKMRNALRNKATVAARKSLPHSSCYQAAVDVVSSDS
eukprot:GSMAST32.ASY1.ANO1.2185.1 assembled CDS